MHSPSARSFGTYAAAVLATGAPRAISPLRSTDPQTISTFTLLGRLGGGGMGQVYLGQADSGREVAVKVIRQEYATDPHYRARFEREAALAFTVEDRYTAKVFAFDTISAMQWIATEYIPGPTVGDFLRLRGPIGGSVGRALALALAEALGSLHRSGVVHRDIKPANVILAEDGPRIIDFGIAKAPSAEQGPGTGSRSGSGPWMSPEQFEGLRTGPATDIYAWGLVVAFALTGRHPFEGTPVEMYPIQPLLGREPDLSGLPHDIAGVVRRALAAEPDRRPSAQDVMNALMSRPHASASDVVDQVTRAWQAPPSHRDTQGGQPHRPGPTIPYVSTGASGAPPRTTSPGATTGPKAKQPGPTTHAGLQGQPGPKAQHPGPTPQQGPTVLYVPAGAAARRTRTRQTAGAATGYPTHQAGPNQSVPPGAAPPRPRPGQSAGAAAGPRPPHTPKRASRRGLAAAGLAAVVVILAALALGGGQLQADLNMDVGLGSAESERTVSPFDLVVGDCISDPQLDDDGGVGEFTVVPCSEFHNGEVIGVMDDFFDSEQSYPSDDVLGERGHAGCVAALEDYTGSAFADSPYWVMPYTPSSQSWETGDRGLLCVAYEPDSDFNTTNVTGSIKA